MLDCARMRTLSIYPPLFVLVLETKHRTHTNPFNLYFPPRVVPLSDDYPVVIRQARAHSGVATTLRPGGLKGKTAPGDAHPYLALF